MRNFLSDIRREAAGLVALKHPEWTYGDIGIALGYAPLSAKAMVSDAIIRQGVRRKRGRGSLAYKTFDREQAAALLKDKTLTYAAIAKKVGCHKRTVGYLAAELDLQRGKGRGARSRKPRASDAQIEAYIKKVGPHYQTKKVLLHFGYAPRSSTVESRILRIALRCGIVR